MCSCGFCDVSVVTVCESGCGRVGVGEGVWCWHVGSWCVVGVVYVILCICG